MPPRHDVFLSYNSRDKPSVERLARLLREQGITTWLDSSDLVPGAPWQPAIETALAECAACAVMIGPAGLGAWQHEEMRMAIDRQVSERRCRVIPVLLPGAERGERSQLPRFLVANTWVEFRGGLEDAEPLRRLVSGIRGEPPGPGRTVDRAQCPYLGLKHYDVADADSFFGRDAETGWLLEALRPKQTEPTVNRFLAIVGASGSGKTSLARAGLLAALKRGELPGSTQWPQLIVRPGANPLESLGFAARDLFEIGTDTGKLDHFVAECQASPRALHQKVGLALADRPREHRVAILVDQFEEVFTLCSSEPLRQAFIQNLLYAAGAANGQTVVVLTIRADFVGRCAAYEDLASMISARQELVGPMSEEGLRATIEWPARRAGCTVAPELTETLVKAVRSSPGSLPLLQHALVELWNVQEGGTLAMKDYGHIGGLEGALAQRAERIVEALGGCEDMIRRIFLRLAQPGEGTEDTRRRAFFSELVPAGASEAEVRRVIDALADPAARLLVIDDRPGGGEAVVDVTHEALIRAWPRLRRWIEGARESIRIQNRLTDAAREWQRGGRDADQLYRGARLAEALEWEEKSEASLNALEREFLARSRAERDSALLEAQARRKKELEDAQRIADIERERAAEAGKAAAAAEHARSVERKRKRTSYAASGLLLLGLIGAIWLWSNGDRQRRIAQSRQLAIESEIEYRRLDRQLLLAANALSAFPTNEAKTAMFASFSGVGPIGRILVGHKGWVGSVAFSPDGKTLASGGQDGTVILWDVASQRVLGEPLAGPSEIGPATWGLAAQKGGPVYSVAFSSDGKTLASVGGTTP